MAESAADWLIEQIRAGSESAWQELIDCYEGRLAAFVRARLRDRHVVEDVVQETFCGFLRSLPHFDTGRDLESYLFTIAAHKIRDHLRREGRRPLGFMTDLEGSSGRREPAGRIRGASSLLASAERLANALADMIADWRKAGDYRRIKCIELLFVAGWANKDVAGVLDLTEQQVANYKYQVIESLGRRAQSEKGS